MNLQFHMPTKVFMEENCVLRHADLLKPMGKKALIVTGKNSARITGALGDVRQALETNGQEYALFDEVMSNPTIECVYRGASVAREVRADFIVAIGGGSPMDAAKAIALLAVQDIGESRLFSGDYQEKILPAAFVPTTAGTGSEVTQYSILTNDKARTKTALSSPVLFPKIAFLDGGYTKSLPRKTTVHTAVDALSHSIEGYLSNKANPLTRTLALEGIGIIARLFSALRDFSLSGEDRERLLYASMLGGMVIAQTGTTAVHAMGYSLTYFKNVDHGQANGLLLAEFMKFTEKTNSSVIREILEAMELLTVDDFQGIMRDLLGSGDRLSDEEAQDYAGLAAGTKNIGNCIVRPAQQDLLDIYRKIFGSRG